ncbi:hypothetical protein P170DRAFT_449643 [Aspergillus steynii IBT 23096]|uniref:Carbohydrate esterase family 16 protein n=1 Tax=Aspergillus steynii IBT 23096 TaxID=1392250 RepID=A0A2I2FZQ9_9EURO|nr:uncharacterized protein P170DRAFT_449643 [Aspergillus steynii IBT 23096]PLB46113.1 hypothetical protein P170DRAFT_449643 [Aspergillus steynii IBT 23096]
MGNPSLGQGTTADGINWVGYLTTEYNASVVMNYNLAAYGATVDDAVVDGKSKDLVYQVTSDFNDYYCLSLEPSREWRPDTTLFGIWIGINDVLLSYMRDDPLEMISRILQSYLAVLDHLHECGARHFLLLNVPPTDRTPQMRWFEYWQRERHREVVVEFNRQLQAAVVGWRMTHRDSTMALYDSWSLMTEILDNPQIYGFEDGECMGQGCVWWDDLHPTSEFHRLLADDLATYLSQSGTGFV